MTAHDVDAMAPPSFAVYAICLFLWITVLSLGIVKAKRFTGLDFLPTQLLIFIAGAALAWASVLVGAAVDPINPDGDDFDAFSSSHWKDGTSSVLVFLR